MSSAHRLIAASRVHNVSVFSPAGDKLGRIDDVMIEKATGRAAYALMSHDGFLGVGERYYPIPWSALVYDTSKRGYVAPIDAAGVERGHATCDREINDEIEWREAVHDLYGAAPYWTGQIAI